MTVESQKATCASCKQAFEDAIQIEAIRDWGICLGCDKLNFVEYDAPEQPEE